MKTKMLILGIALLFCELNVFSQAPVTGRYLPLTVTTYGEHKAREKVDSALLGPTGCGAPTTLKSSYQGMYAQYFDSCNHRFYVYDPKTKTWDSVHIGVSSSTPERFGKTGEDDVSGTDRQFECSDCSVGIGAHETTGSLHQTDIEINLDNVKVSTVRAGGRTSYMRVYSDSIDFHFALGVASIYRGFGFGLRSDTDTTYNKPMVLGAGGEWKYLTYWPMASYGAGSGLGLFGTTFNLGGTLSSNPVFYGANLYGSAFSNHTTFNISDITGDNRFSMASTGLMETKLSSAARATRQSFLTVRPDSILVQPSLGNFYIDTLTNSVGTKSLRYNPTTGKVTYADTTTAGGGTPSLNATQIPFGDGSNLMTSDAGIVRTAAGQMRLENASNSMIEWSKPGTDAAKWRIYNGINGNGFGLISMNYTTYRWLFNEDGSGAIFGNALTGGTLRASTAGNIGAGVDATSQLHTTSFAASYHKVTADAYVITASDYTLSVDNEGGSWTIKLPDATTCSGRIYIIKRYANSSTGGVTINSDGGDVQNPKDGTFGSSYDLEPWSSNPLPMVMYQSNGTNWEAIK